ncbi:hypothetical protein E8E13_001661 [Curvularia kusanoi]|uniref:Uncharacterized protein n=1 Tax=Curvularia kusanoi TaxID=90978 RepID=A0A9P4TBA0_CURKU|nr:hypothetical protein E8E13_001661 [Curvularia kusanoi]
MVDQLWLWIINENTVVSCSPRVTHFNSPRFEDFMESILPSELEQCADSLDLTTLLVMRSVTNVFTEQNKAFADIVAIYRWAINIKAATHTEKLEEFGRKQSSSKRDHLDHEGIEELNLTLEVADILDELNMLLLLLETQTRVLSLLKQKLTRVKPAVRQDDTGESRIHMGNARVHGGVHVTTSGYSEQRVHLDDAEIGSLHVTNDYNAPISVRAVGGFAGHCLHEALQGLDSETSSLERLVRDATRTHELLNQLLDLQQKAASLTEARVATTQGKAVMLFTIVTIVFLPLSFFTSYFGQNVSELTGDEKNPSSAELWRIAGPISVVVILFALLVAYFIMYPPMRKEQDSDQVTEPA